MTDHKVPMIFFLGEPIHCYTEDRRQRRTRYVVRIGGTRVLLPWLPFRLLLDLAFKSSASEDGWVDRFALTPGGDKISKYTYRLRRELAGAGVDHSLVLDKDHQGKWRLLIPPSSIKICAKRLIALGDPGITRWVMEVCSSKRLGEEDAQQ